MVPLNFRQSPGTLPWAVGAIVLLLAAVATLFSSAGVSLASSGKYIHLCMAAMPNGDDREQGGDFTFAFHADGNPVPFATLTMARLEDPGIFCEDLYPSDYGVADTATFVVREAAKPPSWQSKPDYPKFVQGNPPLASGDTTPPFTIAAQWANVTFYDWAAIAPRLTVCKGIEENGDVFADTGTFQFTVAVKGQAPFQTVTLSSVENQEEECDQIFLEDVPLPLPVTLVVSELAAPGFQNAPGYPKYYDTAVPGLVSGETVELVFDADNRELSAWFMNRRAPATVVPEVPEIPQLPGPIETPSPVSTPAPAPSATASATPVTPATTPPSPGTPAPSAPTPQPATPPGGNTAGATIVPLPPRTGNAFFAAEGDRGMGILFLALAALSGSTAVVLAAFARRR
jgi:cell division septation protein DedD